ncbi:zinc finger protein 142-like isoform X2 [Achroia grisella]|uniref:zinc finger protein 142-like isoform X2 n=1 Tax=Achroia grisella TaxID=688607 RepID=UPI0027D24EA8|nr:zinc finger protein 142-like isoform X2 [Achroia grisella]
MFRSEAYRINVEKTNSSHVYYNCDMCDDGGWCSETELEIHRNSMHPDLLCELLNNRNKIVCYTCKREQPDRKTLLEHIKVEHLLSSKNATRVERQIYVCDYCSYIFFNKLLLAAHIQKKHYPKSRKTCIQCPKCLKTTRPTLAYGHFELHQFKSITLCPICLDKCTSRQDLLEHLKMHTKYYHCNMCAYETKKETNYLSHLLTHKKFQSQYTGDFTKYYIPVKGVMKKKFHSPYVINGLPLWNNLYICILCREICTTRNKMQLHITEHEMPKVMQIKRHMCSCGEEFFNNVLLKHHIFKLKGNHNTLVKYDDNAPSISQEMYIVQE